MSVAEWPFKAIMQGMLPIGPSAKDGLMIGDFCPTIRPFERWQSSLNPFGNALSFAIIPPH